MDRRDFFKQFDLKLSEIDSKRANLIQSIEIKSEPLSKEDAYHLLRRLTFGADLGLMNQITGMSASAAVDLLLGDGLDYLSENTNRLPNGQTDLNWVNTPEENPFAVPLEIRFEIEGKLASRYNSFVNWWLSLMHNYEASQSGFSREKITMFWHSHWCIAFDYDTDRLIPPPMLYRNNQKIRKHRLGNFQKFVEEMTLDGAYLLYQSLNLNTKDDPNENYMRELMELFTMGIGNYEERDIVQGTRALTGWRVTAHLGDIKPHDFFDTYFAPQDHDLGKKTILGDDIAPRNVDDNTMVKVREEEVYKLIDILFKRRGDAIAKFIATKIYRYFVYSNPIIADQEFINELANVLKSNNFELRPLFKALFTSTHFFDTANRACQIKAPTDYIIGLQRTLGASFDTSSSQAISDLEQMLYNPPNVSGWPDYHSWISTITYPNRIFRAANTVKSMQNSEVKRLIDLIPNFQDSWNATDQLAALILPQKVTVEQRNAFHSELVRDKTEQNWKDGVTKDEAWIYTHIKNTLVFMIHSPDFQLS